MTPRMNTDKHGASRTRRASVALVLGLTVAALAGCNLLPAPQSDPTRFYVLSTTPARTAPAGGPEGKGLTIHLRPIELASYIKAKPIIVRHGDNEVEFRDYARWGEPLERGIGRVLREELVARGAASAVLLSGLRVFNVTYDYELTVRVLACEGQSDGTVIFRAAWELSTTGASPRIAARGEFQPADLKWGGKSESSLVSGLSAAVAGLAGDIAAGLSKAREQDGFP